ncbi:hypothetical protein FGO68_gene8332 [Halteria grandinella]|uniref:Uncharacterized protein n=1 Tax=Halteria grandinella TaxID=5974 RepID=A0A8J8T879_HALGN|nr:hypothetical protein FGO68_gene8332 [Halteria grandinella]
MQTRADTGRQSVKHSQKKAEQQRLSFGLKGRKKSSQEQIQPLEIIQQDVVSNQASSCESLKSSASSSQPSQAFSFLNKENDFKLDQWKNYHQILYQSLILSLVSYFCRLGSHFFVKREQTDELIWNSIITNSFIGLLYWIYCQALKRKKWTMKYGIGIYLFSIMVAVVEAWIADNPDTFSTSYQQVTI